MEGNVLKRLLLSRALAFVIGRPALAEVQDVPILDTASYCNKDKTCMKHEQESYMLSVSMWVIASQAARNRCLVANFRLGEAYASYTALTHCLLATLNDK